MKLCSDNGNSLPCYCGTSSSGSYTCSSPQTPPPDDGGDDGGDGGDYQEIGFIIKRDDNVCNGPPGCISPTDQNMCGFAAICSAHVKNQLAIDGIDENSIKNSGAAAPTATCQNLPADNNQGKKRDTIQYDIPIPLVSSYKGANPYSPDLTGIDPNVNLIRRGFGAGLVGVCKNSVTNDETPYINCNSQQAGALQYCSITVTCDISVTDTTSLSISNGGDTVASISNSDSWGKQTSDAISKNIADSLEKISQYTNTTDFQRMNSTEIQNSTILIHMNETSVAHGTSTEFSIANSTTWDNEVSHSTAHDTGTNDQTHTGNDITTTLANGTNARRDSGQTNAIDITCTIDTKVSSTDTIEESVNVQVFSFLSAGVSHTSSTTQESGSSTTFHFSVQLSNTLSKGLDNSCTVAGTTFNDKTHIDIDTTTTTDGTVTRNGGQNTVTNGRGTSDTNTTTQSDSISDGITKGATFQNTYGDSYSNMYGTNIGHTWGLDKTKTATDNTNHDLTLLNSTTVTYNVENTHTVTVSKTYSASSTFQLNVGACVKIACQPIVNSHVIPYFVPQIGNPDTGKIYVAEYQWADTTNGTCAVTAIDCRENILPPFTPFPIMNSNALIKYGHVAEFSSSCSGGTNCNPIILSVPNSNYALKFFQAKDIGLPYDNAIGVGLFYDNQVQPEWTTGVFSQNMAGFRINDKGQLEQYTNNFYKYPVAVNTSAPHTGPPGLPPPSTGVPPLTEDVIWSSVSDNNRDYRIGVPNANNRYKLVLELTGENGSSDSAELKLFDGHDIMIWSNVQSKNKYGFMYPTNSRWSTLRPELQQKNQPGQVDPHNTLPDGITVIGNNLNTSCTSKMYSGQAIQSDDGRFTLYLDHTGNLVLYDFSRVMWQSFTANAWFSKGPYSININDELNLVIKDSQNYAVWKSVAKTRKVLFGKGPDLGVVLITPIDLFTMAIALQSPTASSNTYINYNLASLECDSCSANCTHTGQNGYLMHLASGKVSPVPFTWTGHQFIYNGSDYFNSTRWIFYNDGFLTRQDRLTECLDKSFAIIDCRRNGLRIDKLWGFVPTVATTKLQLGSLNSILDNDGRIVNKDDVTRFMLLGNSLNNAARSVSLNSNGDLIMVTKGQLFPAKIPTNLVLKEPPMLALSNDGSLRVTNLYENVTFNALYTNTKTNTKGPYSLRLEGAQMVIRDSTSYLVSSISF
ncbi:hypothetical protein HDV01_003075 [Terramyces sp. JEL0728]|nr:hypothetical protein HDV01_003075 [Terramyces sp. JEL0728]